MSKNKKTISKLLINRLLVFTIAINIVTMIIISNTASNMIRELETEHLTEIVKNIENNVISTIDKYIQLSEVISKNTLITNLMIESNKENPMHLNENKDIVIQELHTIATNFEGIVINFGLLDVDQDGYLTQNGEYSDDTFSFKERDYYLAVETKETVVTTPYLDVVTGFMVISVATPIIHNNEVIGSILIDLSIEFLNDLIIATEYKETGSSLIFGNNDVILAYNDISLIGEPISILNFDKNKEVIQSQFANPTGELITYTFNNTEKIGIMKNIDEFDWKILTFMKYSEFNSYANKILTIFTLIQGITIIITLIIASFTINMSLKPINYIKKAMAELAKGNTKYKLDYVSDNEIGDLADNVRFANESIAHYIHKIQIQLDYDDLTNLYTEQKFIKEIEKLIVKNSNSIYYIVSVDIDNFKYINDTYGYEVGSKFLKMLADYYTDLIGENAIISRVNGDNYLFLLDQNQLNKFKDNVDYFNNLSVKAQSVVDESYDLSVSCGVYKITDKTMSISSMIDCSSYARNKGKCIAGFSTNHYNDIMNAERTSNNYVVSKMRDAVKNKEFVVYYQPKVDLITNEIVGAEALVRWNNNGKIIPPNSFIPVFETNGFIETLDYYVIDATCEFIKTNEDKNIPLISINLSGVTIMKNNVISQILSIIEKYGLKPVQIELEITESAFVKHFDTAIEKINEFRKLGFSISMDDFGCGESSLGRLKDIPIDVIKIDREFVIDVFENDKANLILKNITNMAKDLNLKTVVEGIETEDQRNLIANFACDLGQGYLFSRPVPADEFLKIIE